MGGGSAFVIGIVRIAKLRGWASDAAYAMFGPSRDDDDIARGKFELVLTFDRETRLASAEHITPEVGAARLMQRPGVWPAHSHHLDLIEPQVAQQRINELVHDQVPSPPEIGRASCRERVCQYV